MIEIKVKDYLEFTGIDLKLELMKTPSDNIAKQPEIFIERIKEFVKDYMKDNFSVPRYDPSNKDEVLKKAILYQMEYFLEHGNLSLYNPDKLPILSPNSYRVLKNAGLANGILL